MLNNVAIFNLNSMSIAFLSNMSMSRCSFDAVSVGPKVCKYYDHDLKINKFEMLKIVQNSF